MSLEKQYLHIGLGNCVEQLFILCGQCRHDTTETFFRTGNPHRQTCP